MKFINLTPHDVTVVGVSGNRTFAKSGTIARVSQISSLVEVVDGIDIKTVRYGEVVNLPSEVDGVRYIVSTMVKNAVNGRIDLVSPGEMVRDANGVVIGCKDFYL